MWALGDEPDISRGDYILVENIDKTQQCIN